MILLDRFISESNKIEGIRTDVRRLDAERVLYDQFLALAEISVPDLALFVLRLAGASLRDRPGMDVRVGEHVAPRGGPAIPQLLEDLLVRINGKKLAPFHAHQEYERLHPFMDGNGRSGRMLWLWMHLQQSDTGYERAMQLGFLHTFYYESLHYWRVA